jgi:penicillin amidase
MLARRPEPLIYEAWIWELQRGLLADELGESSSSRWRRRTCR